MATLISTPADDWKPPAHVPDDLVLGFNPWLGMEREPHAVLAKLHEGPPIVFSRYNHILGFAPQGNWIITRAEVMREVLLNAEVFSSTGQSGIAAAMGEDFELLPLESNPPAHTKYRALVNPFFYPKAVRALESKIIERVDGLIDTVQKDSGCDFVASFAKILPSGLFLDMMGLPKERLGAFLEWEELIMCSRDPLERLGALKAVCDYLRSEIDERRATPRDDMLSKIVHAEIDGAQIPQRDALGMSLLLYIAGLDTVVNSLGWQFKYLAENPEAQAILRADPSRIPAAVEELYRSFAMVTASRVVTRDFEIGGVLMRAGDIVSCPTPLASRDDTEFAGASSTDLSAGQRRHLAFGFGPHMCLGMHLARVESTISIRRWLERMPPFRIAPDAQVPCHGGLVLAVDSLPLRWD